MESSENDARVPPINMMSDTAESGERLDLREHFRRRLRECQVEARAYEIWLGLLTPARWLTVIGGILLSAIAGGVVLVAEYRVEGIPWRIWGARSAILASVLTGIHTGLHCDTHQTECRRLVQLYSGLATAYEAAPLLPGERLNVKFEELEARFEQAKSEAAASPPQWCRRRANRAD